MPCLMALREERRFPAAVRGPVDLRELRRLAAALVGEVGLAASGGTSAALRRVDVAVVMGASFCGSVVAQG